MPTDNLDLGGLLDLQKTYVNELAKLGASKPAEVNTQFNTLNTSLDTLNSQLGTSIGSADAILTDQQKMDTIITNENARLVKKKESVDNEFAGQKRAISMNENYKLRNQEYIKMIVVIVFALIILIGTTFLSKTFLFIPSYVFEVLNIIIISAALYICYIIYVTILSRDKNDFNKLDLEPPQVSTPAEMAKSQKEYAKLGDLLGSINLNGCAQETCCSVGTRWDSGNAVCKGNLSGFTTMGNYNPFNTIELSYNSTIVLPSSPNEFENYTKI